MFKALSNRPGRAGHAAMYVYLPKYKILCIFTEVASSFFTRKFRDLLGPEDHIRVAVCLRSFLSAQAAVASKAGIWKATVPCSLR